MAEKPAKSERNTVEVLRFLKEAPVIEIVLPKERRKQITPVHNERKQHDHIECELFDNERIAFVDEDGKRIGRLELVNDGTLITKECEHG